MMTVIVTGGIGSGKSEFCRILADKYQIPVYEADRKAKELYHKYPELLESMESALKCRLRDNEGRFRTELLAEVIFGNADALMTVENLLFPYMKADYEDFAKDREVVVFESATVLEKEQFDDFGDYVILVDAPYDIRLHRACRRDRKEKEEIIARMSAQRLMNAFSDGSVRDYPSDSRLGRAASRVDRTVMNDGNPQDLEASADEAVSEILKIYEKLNDK